MSVRVFRDDDQPLRAIDMAPIAAVVGLIALIVTFSNWPKPVHGMIFDVGVFTPPHTIPEYHPEANRLRVRRDGSLWWNGVPIDLVTLNEYLAMTRTQRVEPDMHVVPEPLTAYGQIAPVLAVIKRSGVSRPRFTGLDRYARFDRDGAPLPN